LLKQLLIKFNLSAARSKVQLPLINNIKNNGTKITRIGRKKFKIDLPMLKFSATEISTIIKEIDHNKNPRFIKPIL